MLKGFKEFITRGNVIEMAVGFIIGNAFKDIVDSLVNNVINPLIGMIFGKPDFSNMLIFSFNGSSLKFGVLLTAVINFLLIAFALYFFLVVPMNALAKRKKKAEDAAPKEVSEEVQLLTEIRDALAKGDRA
ncbi:large conductance mechanosensitive channel protein [Actinomyces sp. ICM58]|jgi:large conductance mechanosensitive channel protein|uniref:large conductance mechanosensitive channel protein MscL n=1 Tax=unclassified Actinomyces TaxID=2609248 RepID=UPI00027727C7|nr:MULTISPECIES: large conductance mechanosensitive channel protein MscL [unclassified Actinomyces]EJN51669.1 large conductance mechanosensitive channel protein [Actinomyces sp. ICM58]